ncbi:hypothetical protein RGAI101_3226 [Roseobacter sp. GAI101]|nr:hypothetical protein RGAI101_3226 [Roseobacter sp. GAI101]
MDQLVTDCDKHTGHRDPSQRKTSAHRARKARCFDAREFIRILPLVLYPRQTLTKSFKPTRISAGFD